jgi:hypothetical protein
LRPRGGLVELIEGDLAVVVDDRGAVGRAARVERGDHAEFAPAPHVGDHRGDVLRRFQLEGAGLKHFEEIVQFCGPSLGVLLGFGDCLQRKIG